MPQTGFCGYIKCSMEIKQLDECHCCNKLICFNHLTEHVEINKQNKQLTSVTNSLELIIEKKLEKIQYENKLIEQAKELIQSQIYSMNESNKSCNCIKSTKIIKIESSSLLNDNDCSIVCKPDNETLISVDNNLLDDTINISKNEDEENTITRMEICSIFDRCPLTFDGAFGLTQGKNLLNICSKHKQRKCGLYDHFMYKHDLKAVYARRLVEAIIDEQDSMTTKLFNEDEDIVDHLFRFTCPFNDGTINLFKYWSAMLANKKWAPITSWITGWSDLVENWTLTTSICFSGGQLILSAIGLWNEAYVPAAWHVVLVYWAILLAAFLTNILAAKHLDFINTVCIYWTAASVLIILVTVLTMAKGKITATYVFTEFDATRAGWPVGWAFFVGLLQSAYTLTGYGMVAAMCEEVQNPEREVPKAMVLSVVAAGITGVIFLIPILFLMPDIDKLLAVSTGQPIGYLFMTATGSAGGGFGLLYLILGIQFFAGIGSLTAASRCLYAFSRDGAVPRSQIWSKINKHYDVPLYALLLSTLVAALLGLIYLGSSAAFNAFTGVSTLCLSASYALPVFILLFRRRHVVKDTPFHLGKFGYIINIITILWIFLAIVIFTMPTAIPVTASSMNYTSVLFVFFAGVSVLWYIVWGRKHFSGPPLSPSE